MCRSRRMTLRTPAAQTAVRTRASAKAMPALRYGKLLDTLPCAWSSRVLRVAAEYWPLKKGLGLFRFGIVYPPLPCAWSSRVLRVAAEYWPLKKGLGLFRFGIVYPPLPCAWSSRVLRVAAEYWPLKKGLGLFRFGIVYPPLPCAWSSRGAGGRGVLAVEEGARPVQVRDRVPAVALRQVDVERGDASA